MRSMLDYCLLQVNINIDMAFDSRCWAREMCVCVCSPCQDEECASGIEAVPQSYWWLSAETGLDWSDPLNSKTPDWGWDETRLAVTAHVRVLFKGMFHLIMKTLSFIQLHVIPNLYDLLSSVKHKSRSLAECSCCSFRRMKVNSDQIELHV